MQMSRHVSKSGCEKAYKLKLYACVDHDSTAAQTVRRRRDTDLGERYVIDNHCFVDVKILIWIENKTMVSANDMRRFYRPNTPNAISPDV